MVAGFGGAVEADGAVGGLQGRLGWWAWGQASDVAEDVAEAAGVGRLLCDGEGAGGTGGGLVQGPDDPQGGHIIVLCFTA